MRFKARSNFPLRALLIFITATSIMGVAAPASAAVKFLPGAVSANDPYAPGHGNGGYDVQNYSISMLYLKSDGIDATIKAVATITAKATQNLSKFSLDLNDLKTTKVTINNKSAKFSTTSSKISITPPQGILKGKVFTTAVSYEGKPGAYLGEGETTPSQGWLHTKTGTLAVGEPYVASYWFPSNDHPSDKATFTIAVTAPAALTVVSNGNLKVDPVVKSGTKTWVWVEKYPMAPHNTVLAVGDYTLLKSVTTSGIPVISAYENSIGAEGAVTVRKALDFIPSAMDTYIARFGKYPLETTGAIVADIALNYAMETQERPLYSISNLNSYAENLSTVVIHELAHQWYADSVTPKRWSDMWLNEGFASYAQWVWGEDQKNEPALYQANYFYNATAENFPHRASVTSQFAYDAFWSVKVGQPAVPDLFSKAVYTRGAMTLHALRTTVGDATFYDILKGWATKKAYSNATNQEFIAFAQSKTKIDLKQLFIDWLDTTSKPTKFNYDPNAGPTPEVPSNPNTATSSAFDLLATDLAGVPNRAWNGSSIKIASSAAKQNILTILIGPHTIVPAFNVREKIDGISKLYKGFGQVDRVYMIFYTFEDVAWAQSQVDKIYVDPWVTSAANNCPALDSCGGASAGTDNKGDGIILKSLAQRSQVAGFVASGDVIAHEYVHTVQDEQFIGSAVETDALKSLGNHVPSWIVEGQADFAMMVSTNSNLQEYLDDRVAELETLRSDKTYTLDWIKGYLGASSEKLWKDYEQDRFYDLGFLFVEIVTSIKGPDTSMQFFSEIARGRSFTDVFADIFGMSWEAAMPLIAEAMYKEIQP